MIGGAKINDADIATADIPVTNGVIQGIDKAIMPPTS
ncbi:MAG: fasciclin domain-containing protein [Pararhodobacter sp.]|nr:fasciclin domain-containing protein [Pararhodobacter sp.]